MHVPFKIQNVHYRTRPPSWDDRNYNYGHQFYPRETWETFRNAAEIRNDLVHNLLKHYWSAGVIEPFSPHTHPPPPPRKNGNIATFPPYLDRRQNGYVVDFPPGKMAI